MAQIQVFVDAGFPFGTGAVINLPPGWGYSYVGDDWNDKISSVIVLSGTWQFFANGGFIVPVATVGPGYYPFVENPPFDMANDTISSIRCISD